MTEKEKRTILDMRAAGKQYKEIKAELGIDTYQKVMPCCNALPCHPGKRLPWLFLPGM